MKKTSRRGFGKQLTWAIGALPLASLAADTVGAQDRRNQKGKDRPIDGSPITVGGGGGIGELKGLVTGVGLKFNHDNGHYPDPYPNTEKKKKFKNNNWSMGTLKLAIGAQIYDFSDDLPPDRDCTIKITCARDDDDITIEGKKPLSVEFDTRKYRKLAADPNVHDYDTYITKLKIDAGRYLQYEKVFAQGAVWELMVDWE